jgi:hypothetical protein
LASSWFTTCANARFWACHTPLFFDESLASQGLRIIQVNILVIGKTETELRLEFGPELLHPPPGQVKRGLLQKIFTAWRMDYLFSELGHALPRHASPHLTSPHLTSPHLTLVDYLTLPYLTSPHLASSYLVFRSHYVYLKNSTFNRRMRINKKDLFG